jgi:hypothetical protein
MKILKQLLSALSFTMLCCFSGKAQSDDFLNQAKMYSFSEFTTNGYAKIKLVFRHHGNGQCICPGCACPGCTCPVGICICSNISRPQNLGESEELTSEDVSNGFGVAWVKIVNSKMHIIFESPNDSKGVLPVDTSPYADSIDAPKFNSSTPFYIVNGNYTVVKTKYTHGEAVLDITF